MKYLSYIFLALFLLVSCKKEEQPEEEIIVEKPKTERFGFIMEDYVVVNDTIKSGDTFGKLLEGQGFNATEIHNVVEKIKDSLNLKNIRAGRPYTLLKSLNAPHNLEVLVYQSDMINYSVIDFRGDVIAYNKQKPVTIKRKTIISNIEGSLSQTLGAYGNGNLTHNLEPIYAWSVNFFKLQPEDAFGVIFSERYINDTIYVGIESIEGSFFIHNKGEKIYAFPFRRDSLGGSEEYFDEEAKALKSMFLKAPLKFSRISSKFSPRRFHPVQKKMKPHLGTDYAAPHGTPIMTTANGVVEASGYTSGNGNFVKVKHDGTYSTQYLHMSRIAVKKGQRVTQGETIGYVGSTGLATGPHVCYRFWKNGVQVDPLQQNFKNSTPLEEKYKERYFNQINPIKKELDSIANSKLNIKSES